MDKNKELPKEYNDIEIKLEETGKQAVTMVEGGDEDTRNLAIAQTRETLRKLMEAKPKDGSSIERTLKYSASYLADRYPQTVTAVTAFIAIENCVATWVEPLWKTDECDFGHQVP